MLERGITSIEPSVQRLLRQIERPVRSQRRLGREFWSRNSQTSQNPDWWPLFLSATQPFINHHNTYHPSLVTDQNGVYARFLHPSLARYDADSTELDQLTRRRPSKRQWSDPRHTYSTSSSRREDNVLAQYPDANDVVSSKHDFWSQHSPIGLEQKQRTFGWGELGKPTESDRVRDEARNIKEATMRQKSAVEHHPLTPKQISAERSQSLILAAQSIAEYDQSPVDKITLDLRRVAALSALELDDFHLVKHICQSAQATPHLAELGNTVLEKLLKDRRLSEAAQILELMVPEMHVSEYKLDGVTSMLPDIAYSALRLRLSAARLPYDPDSAGLPQQMTFLATVLLSYMSNNRRIMGGLTPAGFTTLIDTFDDSGLLDIRVLFNMIGTLWAMSKTRNRSQFSILVYRVLRQKFPDKSIPTNIFGRLIEVLGQSASSSSAELRFVLQEFAAVHGKADHAAYQRVMTACAQKGDKDAVSELLSEYRDVHGDTQNITVLNSMLYVHARVGNIDKSREEFDRLSQEFGVSPDVVCWNTLLQACNRADDIEGAIEVFRGLIKAGIEPNKYTFGTIMALCARSGDTEAVLFVAREAERRDVPLTFPMLDTLVRSYCINDNPEKAEEIAEAAMDIDTTEDPIRIWNSLLVHHAHRADTQQLLRLQQRMKELNVVPDAMTYAALMLSLTKIGKTYDALNILRALHLSQHIDVSPTHYAILMHGFARQENRDMVTVLWKELMERHGRPGLGASHAVLTTQIKRDKAVYDKALASLVMQPVQHRDLKNQLVRSRLAQARELPHAGQFLDYILDSVDMTDLASKAPTPGIGKFRIVDAIPPSFFTYMIDILGRRGALDRVSSLLRKYREAKAQLSMRKTETENLPYPLLAKSMVGHNFRQNYWMVEELWHECLRQVINESRSRTSWRSLFSPESQSDSLVDGKESTRPLLAPGLKIWPSHPGALAGALDNYMHSLGSRGAPDMVCQLVEELQNAGLILSSRNWNTYVQILAASTEQEHQFLAFKTFQERLLPNMPSWNLLRRGKILSKGGGSVAKIAMLESINRRDVYAHYYTLVFLGAALMKFRRRSTLDHGSELHRLLTAASETVVAVAKMPYLRDRAQGILLRGRQLKGDPIEASNGKIPAAKISGVLGSKSALDHIPPEYMDDMLELQRRLSDEQHKPPTQDDDEFLILIDKLFGSTETDLRKVVGDPMETNQERDLHSEAIQSRRSQSLQQILHDSRQPRFLANETTGDPSVVGFQNLNAWMVEDAPAPTPTPIVFRRLQSKSVLLDSYITPDGQKISYVDPGFKARQDKARKFWRSRWDSPTREQLLSVVYGQTGSNRRRRAFSRNKFIFGQRRRQRQMQKRHQGPSLKESERWRS